MYISSILAWAMMKGKQMKSNYRNYFKNGKLYQWNKDNTVFTIQEITTDIDCCLDKFGMDMLLKFDKPELKLEGTTLKVEAGNIKASIPTITEALFIPSLKESSEEEIAADPNKALLECELPIAVLKDAASFCANDMKKPILTGVNIQGGRINASDSFSGYSINLGIDERINITIPKLFIDEISKVADATVSIKTDKKVLYTCINGIEYYSVLLDGNFPNLGGLFENISSGIIKEVTTDRDQIKDTLNYCMVSDGVVTLSDYQILVTGENTNIQSMCDLNLGDIKIVLSLAKLKAAMSSVNTSEMTIKVKGATAPIIINDVIMLSQKVQ